MKISEVMTPLPHTVGVEQQLRVAREHMHTHGIRHLPVLSGGRFVGVLSDRDIKLARAIEQKSDLTLSVEDVVITDAYTVEPDADVQDVVKHMATEQLGSAIVVDRGKVVGIFTTTDVCRVLAAVLGAGASI